MTDKSYFINGGEIITPRKVISGGGIFIDRGVIKRIKEKFTPPKNAKVIDLSGKLILPGLIDLHVHGAGGVDIMAANEAELRKLVKALARFGTTTFLPTLRSAALDKIAKVITDLHSLKAAPAVGAKIGGIHLEGPMINPRRRGIHSTSVLGIIPEEFIEGISDKCPNFLKIITLAPELDKDLKFCQFLIDHNIMVSFGHSDADYMITRKAIEKGLNYAVHIFNGMMPLHHRNPGPLGALLTDERVSCEVIADGRHVHSSALKILYQCKGAEKIVLATDSMLPVGTDLKYFFLERKEIIIKNGVPMSAKGVLAGSLLTLLQAVFFFTQLVGCPLREAVNMASLNPAKLMGWDNQLGSIEEGKKADLLVVDNRGKVEMVFIDGTRLK